MANEGVLKIDDDFNHVATQRPLLIAEPLACLIQRPLNSTSSIYLNAADT